MQALWKGVIWGADLYEAKINIERENRWCYFFLEKPQLLLLLQRYVVHTVSPRILNITGCSWMNQEIRLQQRSRNNGRMLLGLFGCYLFIDAEYLVLPVHAGNISQDTGLNCIHFFVNKKVLLLTLKLLCHFFACWNYAQCCPPKITKQQRHPIYAQPGLSSAVV